MALVISKLGKAGDIVEKIIEVVGEVAAEVCLCLFLYFSFSCPFQLNQPAKAALAAIKALLKVKTK